MFDNTLFVVSIIYEQDFQRGNQGTENIIFFTISSYTWKLIIITLGMKSFFSCVNKTMHFKLWGNAQWEKISGLPR